MLTFFPMTRLETMVHVPAANPEDDDPYSLTYVPNRNPFLCTNVWAKTLGPPEFESNPTPMDNHEWARHEVALAWVRVLNTFFADQIAKINAVRASKGLPEDARFALAPPVVWLPNFLGTFGAYSVTFNTPKEMLLCPNGNVIAAGVLGWVLGFEPLYANPGSRDGALCQLVGMDYTSPDPVDLSKFTPAQVTAYFAAQKAASLSEQLIAAGFAVLPPQK